MKSDLMSLMDCTLVIFVFVFSISRVKRNGGQLGSFSYPKLEL